MDVAIVDDEPYWFTHYDLEKEGLIVESIVPSEKCVSDNLSNLYFLTQVCKTAKPLLQICVPSAGCIYHLDLL